jgi:hypothetical protein
VGATAARPRAQFTYIDYNYQVRASLNQDPVERKQIFLLFIALLAAQLQEPGSHAEAMRRSGAGRVVPSNRVGSNKI